MSFNRLPIRAEWRQGESLNGYVDRLFQQNHFVIPQDVVSFLKKIGNASNEANVVGLAGALFESLGVERYDASLARWLAFRRDGDRLFQLKYCPKSRCESCLAEFGIRPAIWDLPYFDRCPIHDRWMDLSREGGHARFRYNTEARTEARLLFAHAFVEGARNWLPEGYMGNKPMTSPQPSSVRDVYLMIATLAFLNQQLHFRRLKLVRPQTVQDAMEIMNPYANDVVHWLFVSESELTGELCQHAGLDVSQDEPFQWGWSPFLLRVHQVARWLIDDERVASVRRMLEIIANIAARHCLIADRYQAGHMHSESLPDLGGLAIVAPPARYESRGDYVDYLRLFARMHGIPALGYGPGGIVVRSCDGEQIAKTPFGYTGTFAHVFTVDKPIWRVE